MRTWCTGALTMGNTHFVGKPLFHVVLKQVSHGPLIAFVGSSDTLTIQVQGILIKSTFIHNAKGHTHLKGDKEGIQFNEFLRNTRKSR